MSHYSPEVERAADDTHRIFSNAPLVRLFGQAITNAIALMEAQGDFETAKALLEAKDALHRVHALHRGAYR